MRIAGEIILKSLGAWVAIWGFSRLLNAPKKLECYTAGVGMIGWAVYLIVEVFNDGILMKNFLAAVAVALVSQAMARHFKAPVILFVIPGILPMVRNCPWNFPRRSASEGIFLRIPQVIYEKSEKFVKTKFFAFFCRIL